MDYYIFDGGRGLSNCHEKIPAEDKARTTTTKKSSAKQAKDTCGINWKNY